jgi:mitosis inhibitor protein kinase SWE1
MHLDMKPANILVDFEGTLKIADFGLAQPLSGPDGIDVEGDREYMAPEMLKGKAGPSADIFSVGLMILETAANVMLPDNGPSWVRLRSGDLSEVPSLTWTPSSEVQQDVASIISDDLQNGRTHNPGNLFGSYKRLELQQPPEFMVNADNDSSLDSIVRWMTAQEPENRPTAVQVLDLDGLRWIAEHRSASTTVFEGHWGPAQFVPVSLADDGDTEMMDV